MHMKVLFVLCLSFVVCSSSYSQVERTSALYKIVKEKDSLLFDVGFNTCNIPQFDSLISEDFEFYHDEHGVTRSKQEFIEGFRTGVCGLPYKAKRVLQDNSVKVFALEKEGVLYGAIESGEHKFYALEGSKPEYLTSTADFTNLWLLEHGQWKLSRALSYNHVEPTAEETINDSLLFVDRLETEKWMKKNRIPTLGIGYIKDGKIVQATVYGKKENGEPYPVNTIWNVASMTKPITAMVAMKLIDEGKWTLDDPLDKYWIDPDIAQDPRHTKLTTRIILSHRTGLPNWRYQSDSKRLAFEFEPGSKYQYSGEGFEYLRHALENRFQKPLNELADELIFKPLGMKDTRYYWDSAVDESRFATWHHGDGSVYKTYKNTSPNAADDLLTTVSDYCTFMKYIMNGAGLSEELYSQMVSPQTTIKAGKSFGLSWILDENVRGGEPALNHGGDDYGVHTIAFILPRSKEGLLIFTNCDNGTDIYIPTIQHFLGTTGQKIIDIETK